MTFKFSKVLVKDLWGMITRR